jgi:hypothetical protein
MIGKITLVCLMLHTAHTEFIDPDTLLSAYNAVFSVSGTDSMDANSPPVAYAEDRLRVLMRVAPGLTTDLDFVRNTTQGELLILLFQSVAGSYISGRGALNKGSCNLVSDPATGILEMVTHDPDSIPVLTCITVVLLCVLTLQVYRRQS